MNRFHTLLATHDLSISRVDHPPHEVHEDPDEEVSQRCSIAFVQTGRFAITRGGRTSHLRPGSVLLSRPGVISCCHHHELCPRDICLSVAFEPAAASEFESAWARAGWSARESATPRLAYVDRRIALAARHDDSFELERWALAALDALVDDTAPASRAAGRRGPRGRYRARSQDLDAVIATCAAIEAEPTVRRSVAERARDVGRTSTQLTHAFRRYLGESPHRVVVRWRIAHAARLRSEGWNVSESCYRAGFEHLGHFSRSFLRALGVHASAWPVLPPAERRRKLQALLRCRA